MGVMADLHAGAPHVPIAQVTRLVSWLNREEPDLIVLLGDYASPRVLGGRRVAPEPGGPERSPRCRRRWGVFAVLGNHDWWVHGRAMGAALAAAGIRVLENARCRHGPALGGRARRPARARALDRDAPSARSPRASPCSR